MTASLSFSDRIALLNQSLKKAPGLFKGYELKDGGDGHITLTYNDMKITTLYVVGISPTHVLEIVTSIVKACAFYAVAILAENNLELPSTTAWKARQHERLRSL
jgi:hypothetical protein